MIRRILLVATLLAPIPALAQVAIPPGFLINPVATATPTATDTSAQTSLTSVPFVWAVNQGLVSVCAAWGANPIAAFPCDSQHVIPPGQSSAFPVLGAAKIALITQTATTTAVVQLNEGYLAPTPASGPPTGTVTADQGTPNSAGNAWPVIPTALYPDGATPITASATGTTAATTATLAGTSGKTTYACGFSITSGATGATQAAATVTGTITGTLNFIEKVPALPDISELKETFSPCVPASATNTAIVVHSAAAGSGGVVAVSAWGYQQ